MEGVINRTPNPALERTALGALRLGGGSAHALGFGSAEIGELDEQQTGGT